MTAHGFWHFWFRAANMHNHERPESLAYLAGKPLASRVPAGLSLLHMRLSSLSLESLNLCLVTTVWCRCGGLWAIQHTFRSLGLHRLGGRHQMYCGRAGVAHGAGGGGAAEAAHPQPAFAAP